VNGLSGVVSRSPVLLVSPLNRLLAAGGGKRNVFVHVARQQIGMQSVGRQKTRDEEIGNSTGFGSPPRRVIGTAGAGFQMGHEHVQGLRETGHGNLGFKKVAGEGAVIAEIREACAVEPVV